MSGPLGDPRRVVVVGGGITGLSAAHRLHELIAEGGLRASVLLLESAPTLGGHVRTEVVDGHLFEGGPDSLVLAKPAGRALCERLGLGDDLVRVEGGRIQILHRGRLRDVPEGFRMMAPTRLGPVLSSSLFSPAGKVRMAMERFLPAAPPERDESLGAFVTRRFGREVLERVAEPILASLFVADADRLSLGATLPQFHEMERRHGSVTRAFAAARRDRRRIEGRHDARSSNVASLRNGFGRIVETLTARLPVDSVRTRIRIDRIDAPPESDRWRIELADSDPVTADAVILACPAYAMASVLASVDAGLAAELDRVDYAPCATVNLAYRADDIGRMPGSVGFFVARTERRPLLAVSFVSVKFPERAPAGRILLRAFLGGALHPEVEELDEDALARVAHDELVPLLRLRGTPVLARTYRFPRAMPQYEVGFPARLESIAARAEAIPGLVLAGSAVGAVGLPDCIASGERAAEVAAGFVTTLRPPPAVVLGAGAVERY